MRLSETPSDHGVALSNAARGQDLVSLLEHAPSMPSVGPILVGLLLVMVGGFMVGGAMRAPLVDAAATPGVVVERSSDDQVVPLPPAVGEVTRVWFLTGEGAFDDSPWLAAQSEGDESWRGYVEGRSVVVTDAIEDSDRDGSPIAGMTPNEVVRHEPYVGGGGDGYEGSWYLVEVTGSSPEIVVGPKWAGRLAFAPLLAPRTTPNVDRMRFPALLILTGLVLASVWAARRYRRRRELAAWKEERREAGYEPG